MTKQKKINTNNILKIFLKDQAQFPGNQANTFSTNVSTKENLINDRYRKTYVLKDDFFGITYLVEDLKAKNSKM